MTGQQLTPEQVRADLARVMKSSGPGDDEGRAAFMLLQLLALLRDRLSNSSSILNMIYLYDTAQESQLPEPIYRMVEKLVAGDMTADEADREIAAAIDEYRQAFAGLGVTPVKPSALYF